MTLSKRIFEFASVCSYASSGLAAPGSGEFHDHCRLSGPTFNFHNRHKAKIHASRCVPRFLLPGHSHQSISSAPAKKRRWFWQKEPIPEGNPEEKIKPAPAWAVYGMLVVWYGAALVLNGTFRSALVQDLGARGAKEAIAAEARLKMGL